MLAEVLQLIFSEARVSQNPDPHIIERGGRESIMVLNGEVRELIAPDTPAAENIHTLDSIIRIAARRGSEDDCWVYVSGEGVRVILNASDRFNGSIGMAFQPSPQHLAFQTLLNGKTPRELVRILRTRLAGAVAHEGIVSLMRQVEFSSSKRTGTEVAHQRESLGRAIEKEVEAKAGALPETLMFSYPCFTVPDDVPSLIRFEAALDLDYDNETISFIPVGDSVAREESRVIDEIAKRLTDALTDYDIQVVRGTIEEQYTG